MLRKKVTCGGGLVAVAILSMVIAASCGGAKLAGTYKNDSMSLTFGPGDKVTIAESFLGTSIECKYRLEGDKIKIDAMQSGGPTYVMTLQKDGKIEGPMGVILAKDKDAK